MTTFTRLLPAQVGPLFPLGRRHLSSENVDQTNDLGPEVGTRTRILHLLRYARLQPNSQQQPKSIEIIFRENGTNPAPGLTYRNSALLVLLNTPLFVNFLRSHRGSEDKSSCEIQDCLTCAMSVLAVRYWAISVWNNSPAVRREFVATLADVWQICRKTFWGNTRDPKQSVGQVDDHTEDRSDVFVTNFLQEMQRQLTAIPSDTVAFQKLFTTHLARRWKCTCGHTTPLDKFEEVLFLPIEVPRSSRRTSTDIVHGIKRALKAKSKALDPRRGSISRVPSHCGSLLEAETIVVNFPEVLLLTVAPDDLVDRATIDVPYSKSEELQLKELIGSKKSGALLDRKYKLIAGTAIQRQDGHGETTIAYARGGPVRLQDKWIFYGRNDVVALDLEELDRSQREKTQQQVNFYPELFVYLRSDDNGLGRSLKQMHEESVQFLEQYGPLSPNDLDDKEQMRTIVGRSHTTVLNHPVGNNNLKFTISLGTLQPGLDESIPFTLDVRYEKPPKARDGHSMPTTWVLDKKIYGRLMPGDKKRLEALAASDAQSPEERKPYARFSRNRNGPATPHFTKDEFDRAAIYYQEKQRELYNEGFQHSLGFTCNSSSLPSWQAYSERDPNSMTASERFGTTGVAAFDETDGNLNPFLQSENVDDPDAMEAEMDQPNMFTKFGIPEMHKLSEQTRNRDLGNILAGFSGGQFQKASKDNFKGNGKKKNNKNNKKSWQVNKNNYRGNNNGQGRGGHHGGGQNKNNNRGGGKGGGKGKGRGRKN